MFEKRKRSSRVPTDSLMIALAYVAFVALGLGSALLGLTWPSIQAEFNAQLSEQGVLLVAMTVGFLIASSASGTLSARLGMGRFLFIGLVVTTVCLFSIFFIESWPLLIVIVLLNGLGRGSVDAGLNAYMAQLYSARVINWLHAAFGVGITITPLMMTAVFSSQLSWRYGYLMVSIFTLGVAVLLFVGRSRWRPVDQDRVDRSSKESAFETAVPARRTRITVTLTMPVLWLALAMSFLYAGSEGTPGNWIFTLFTTGRGIPTIEAAQWVGIYWGMFTFGRIFFGIIISRVNTSVLLRVCMVAALIATGLLWWNPLPWVGFVGLVALGFALAPVFPVLVSSLPRWVGKQHAANAVGIQIAVAGAGFTLIPALAGVIAQYTSLEAIPALVFILLLLLTILYQVSETVATRKRKRSAVAVASAD